MEKLRIKESKFKPEMEYNDWTKQFNVGGGYIEPTKYYNGNTGWGQQHKTNVLDTMFSYLTKIKSFIFQF